jgi:hypothetical protein
MRLTRHLPPEPHKLRGFASLRSCVPGGAVFLVLCAALLGLSPNLTGADFHAGPLFDEFDLTLTPGHRTEAMGPFFHSERKNAGERIWAVPPLLSYREDPEMELKEVDFLYPLMTYDVYGEQYRWQFFQILSIAGGPTQTESERRRLTIFPFYFQQRSTEPAQNYTAFFPFYGHLEHRLFRSDIRFVMWPFYCQTRKKDVVTDNYLVPFFDLRHGDGLHGWQFWPLIGMEHKEITTRTNGFGDIRIISGHDSFFAVWPLFFNEKSGLGTENPQWQQGSLPAYSFLRSPERDSTTVLWPFFNYVDDREKRYREWDLPWPLVVYAWGEGKTTRRIWPFFSRAHTATLESDFYLWPLYKYNRQHSPQLDRRRGRVCFYLYSDLTEQNLETQATMRRVDMWPLFAYRHSANGNTRLQVLALIETLLPGSRSVERNYSPLWSIWRSENNPKAGAASQSLLWNLYRHDTTPETKKCSLLFGLFQYHSGSEGSGWRLFYIPFGKSGAPARMGGPAAPAEASK